MSYSSDYRTELYMPYSDGVRTELVSGDRDMACYVDGQERL